MVSNSQLPSREEEHKFPYQGHALILWFWLVWSIGGYWFLVSDGGESNLFYEAIYILSAIMSAMALNNRLYGINHRIAIHSDFMILPKLIHLWHWKEEKIFFRDIQDIKWAPVEGTNHSIDVSEIEIMTESGSYPIFHHKLPSGALIEILKIVGHKTGLKGDMVLPSQVSMDSAQKPMTWQWRMAGLALFVSIWAVMAISLAEKYHLLLGPSAVFVIPFFVTAIVAYVINRKIGLVKEAAKRWQKVFLLIYLTFYGGISLGFSAIYFNGVLDHSKPVVAQVTLDQPAVFDERKQSYCLVVNVPQDMSTVMASHPMQDFIKIDRSPASTASSNTISLPLCRAEFEKAMPGDQLNVVIKKGFIIGPWISDLKLLSEK